MLLGDTFTSYDAWTYSGWLMVNKLGEASLRFHKGAYGVSDESQVMALPTVPGRGSAGLPWRIRFLVLRAP